MWPYVHNINVHNINDAACLLAVIQTLSIIVGNGEGLRRGRRARLVKLSMRKAFCCLPEQLKLRKGGVEGLAAQTRGRHDPGRLVHLLAALMTSRLLETLELLEELKGPIVDCGGGGREVEVTTGGFGIRQANAVGAIAPVVKLSGGAPFQPNRVQVSFTYMLEHTVCFRNV